MIDPSFDSKNLIYWQNKSYINKIINRWYYFTDCTITENLLFFTASSIYNPSYISLESALSYYQIIPEGVYSTTSISTKKTMEFQTPLGVFSYRHVKPSLFFGYQLIPWQDRNIKIAELEKTILDYLYLNEKINNADAFSALRWNKNTLTEKLNIKKLKSYLKTYNNKALEQRINLLLQYIQHA